MKRLLLLPLLLITLACPSSQPLEQTARDGVAAAKGYLDSAKRQHPECVATPPAQSTDCSVISRGVGAKDALIDAINIYCASADYSTGGGACVPNKDMQPKLQEALNNLNLTISDVKKVGGQ
jgi:hypothetical protein